MKLTISDIRGGTTAGGNPRVRFSLNVTKDDGTVRLTQQGWCLLKGWVVRPPLTRTMFGQQMVAITQIDQETAEEIKDFLQTIPGVVSLMGPRLGPGEEAELKPKEPLLSTGGVIEEEGDE